MASFKLVALLGVLAVFAVSYAANPERDQTVIYGTVGPYDRLLYSEKVDVPKTILTVHQRDVAYPPHSSTPAFNISAIKALDQLRTGKNAYITITKGGLYQKYANVHLKSKRGYPIRYIVEFYGH